MASTPGPSIRRSSKRSRRSSRADQQEGKPRRASRRLDPAGQKVVDFRGGQIGLDVEARVLLVVADPAGEPHRQRAGQRRAEIDAEPRPRGLVERRLQPHLGVRLALELAVLDIGRRARDPHVALDLVDVVVGGDPQRLRFGLVAEHHLLRTEIVQIDGDVIVGRARRQIGPQRHAEVHLGGQRAAHAARDRTARRRIHAAARARAIRRRLEPRPRP